MQSLLTIRRLVLHWSICLTACLGLANCTSVSDSVSNWEVVRQARLRATIQQAFRTTPTLPIPDITVVVDKTPQAITLEDYKQTWFRGDSCALPCWEGITPQETSLEEAIEVLNQHPLITDIYPYDNETIGFFLNLHDRRYGGFLDYQKQRPYTIQEIRLNLYSFSLGELIEAYGEPGYVLVSTHTSLMPKAPSDGSSIYGIGVLYPELGFVVGGYGDSIDAGQEIESVTFFGTPFELPLDQRMRYIFGRMTGSTELIPWQGYQSFRFYCAQVPKSDDLFNSNDCPDFTFTPTPQPKNP